MSSAISVAPLVNWMLMTTNPMVIGRDLMLKEEATDGEKVELEYDFEEDTRRKLQEFLKDPEKNASSIEFCKKILESDIPF